MKLNGVGDTSLMKVNRGMRKGGREGSNFAYKYRERLALISCAEGLIDGRTQV